MAAAARDGKAGNSGGGGGGWTPERSAAGPYNPWLIIIVISLATFMEILDTAIANVALDHIAGSLSVSQDEATWVLTSYLVANAVVVPISAWLSEVIGRKRFYMISVALFTIASLFCGISSSIGMLVVARVFQGIGGGGLAPSEQSFIADTFPPEKRGLAFAAYGVVVIVAPTLGPTLGGFITDNSSWHWIFLINVPVGLLSLVLVQIFVHEPAVLERERRRKLKGGLRIDVGGFVLVALALGCFEIFLDRGERDDWFASGFIVAMAVTSAIAFVLFVTWELLHEDPIVNIRIFANRNFAITFAMMLTLGAVLLGSTQALPQMTQSLFGYTATLAGLVLTTGGFAALLVMPLVGFAVGHVQTRWLLALGFTVQAAALWHLSGFTTDVSFQQLGTARLFQAVGLPFLFIPITNQAYADLHPRQVADASALLNVARNIGGSVGIDYVQATILNRTQFHQSRIVEMLNPLNPAYVEGVGQATTTLAGAEAGGNAPIAQIYSQVQQQASMLSYIDVYWTMALFTVGVALLSFLLKPARGGGEGGH